MRIKKKRKEEEKQDSTAEPIDVEMLRYWL